MPRLRPYVTTGLALTAAGAITFAPMSVAPAAVEVAGHQPASTEVELTAFAGIVDPWIAAFNAASADATAVAQSYFRAPGAAGQQMLVNGFGYLNQVLNSPGSILEALESVAANAQAVFSAATFIGLTGPEFAAAALYSNDPLHIQTLSQLPSFLSALDPQTAEIVVQVVNVLSSPLAGVAIAMAGPLISPAVALLNSALRIVDDPSTALQTLLATPADVIGSFFTGAELDLSALLPLIGSSLPGGGVVEALSLGFGGLFSPGSVSTDVDGTAGSGVGGSIFNAIGVTLNYFGNRVEVPANRLGPLAALTSLSQIIAKALGWSGTGNPLAEVTFPEIEDDAPVRTPVSVEVGTGEAAGQRQLTAAGAGTEPSVQPGPADADSGDAKEKADSPSGEPAGQSTRTLRSGQPRADAETGTAKPSLAQQRRDERAAQQEKAQPKRESAKRAESSRAADTDSADDSDDSGAADSDD